MLTLLKIYDWDKDRRECRVYDDELDITKVIFYYQYIWIINNGHIPKGYVIHHIDENCSNDDISNLDCITHLEHRRIHSLEKHYNLGNTSFKGKVHSEEARETISDKMKEKWKDQDFKVKMAKRKSGLKKGDVVLTQERKDMLSELYSKTVIKDLQTGIIYNSLSQCSKELKKDKRFIKKHPERWEIIFR